MADLNFEPYLEAANVQAVIVGVTYVNGDFWVTNYLDEDEESTIHHIDSDGNTVSSFLTTNFASQGGLAYTGTSLWVLGRSNSVGTYWLNKYTLAGALQLSAVVPATANGIEYAAGFLWTSGEDSDGAAAVDEFSKRNSTPPLARIASYQTTGFFYGIGYHNSLLWLGDWRADVAPYQKLRNYGTDGVADTVYTTNLNIRGLASDGTYLYAVNGTNRTIYRESVVPAGGTVLYRDPTGVLWCAESDSTNIEVSKRTGPWADWGSAVQVASGDYAQPGLSDSGDGYIIVRAIKNTDSKSYQWHTEDGGATWESDGEIT